MSISRHKEQVVTMGADWVREGMEELDALTEDLDRECGEGRKGGRSGEKGRRQCEKFYRKERRYTRLLRTKNLRLVRERKQKNSHNISYAT